jgi:hypothetical protein
MAHLVQGDLVEGAVYVGQATFGFDLSMRAGPAVGKGLVEGGIPLGQAQGFAAAFQDDRGGIDGELRGRF